MRLERSESQRLQTLAQYYGLIAREQTTRYAGAVTLKYKFRNRHFWSEGYYVSTVGLNEATVRKYIREQELHDQMKDKLSVKEYEDPFKGSK